MRYGVLLLGVAALTGTAADAATLWGKVETGMTRAQVEAAYPAGGDTSYRDKAVHMDHVVVTEKCKADADVTFDGQGVVDEVRLSGNGSLAGRCADEVLIALSAKYGQPATSKDKGGSILARGGKTYVWAKGDGITMRFKDYSDGAFGGGGLGRKSWELRYNTASQAVGL